MLRWLLIISMVGSSLLGYSQRGSYNVQKSEIDSLKNLVISATADTSKVQHLIKLGISLSRTKTDSAFVLYNQAFVLAEKIDYRWGMAYAKYYNGVTLSSVKTDNESALDQYRMALAINSKIANPDIYTALSEIYKDTGKVDTSLVLIKKAISACMINNDMSCYARKLGELATLYAHFDSYDSAVYYLKKANSIRGDNNLELRVSEYINLGIYENKRGNYNASLAYYQQAFDKGLSYSAMAVIWYNLGALYADMGEIDSAYTNFIRSAKRAEELKLYTGVIFNYNSIGNLHIKQGNLDSAYLYFKKALTVNSNYSTSSALHSLLGIGKYYLKSENLDSALYYYNKAFDGALSSKNIKMQRLGLLGMADVQIKWNNFHKTIALVNQALALAKSQNSPSSIKRCYSLLHICYAGINKYADAYKYHLLYKAATDSLFNQDKSKEFGRLEAKYEFDKEKEKIGTENRLREYVLEQEVLRKKYLGLAGSAFLLILLSIGYYYYRIKAKSNRLLKTKNELIEAQSDEIKIITEKEKRILGEKINVQERELATLAMLSNEKNSVLNHLNDKLGAMNFDKSNEKDIKELKSVINNNIKKDDSWDTFLHKFEDIYPYFFQKLKGQFESLTLNELKLCGYIKIGMSNNEIMQVANVANSTVKKNLNRLKKKLNLGAEDSIRNFLIGYN